MRKTTGAVLDGVTEMLATEADTGEAEATEVETAEVEVATDGWGTAVMVTVRACSFAPSVRGAYGFASAESAEGLLGCMLLLRWKLLLWRLRLKRRLLKRFGR